MSALETIKQLVDEQTESLEDKEVQEISLDSVKINQFSNDINKVLTKYPNIVSLSLNECNLTTLKNFPNLKNLQRLEMMDNKLKGPEILNLPNQNGLQALCIGGNQVKKLEDLKGIEKFKGLIQLDLVNNEVTNTENYRKKVFEMIPHLQVLDELDQNGEQIQFDEDELDDDDDEDDSDNDDEFNDSELDDSDDESKSSDSSASDKKKKKPAAKGGDKKGSKPAPKKK